MSPVFVRISSRGEPVQVPAGFFRRLKDASPDHPVDVVLRICRTRAYNYCSGLAGDFIGAGELDLWAEVQLLETEERAYGVAEYH